MRNKFLSKQNVNSAIAALLLTAAAAVGANAQTDDKKPSSPAEVWRQALPDGEQQATTPVIKDESTNNVESKETAAQIEKRVLDLEARMMDAFKRRDAVALKLLLADDFLPAGANAVAAASDKNRYVEWATKNIELKSYVLGKPTVRVYRTTAIVTLPYKQQATIAGVAADGDFIATDVWVRNGKLWQAVSRHVSQVPKP